MLSSHLVKKRKDRECIRRLPMPQRLLSSVLVVSLGELWATSLFAGPMFDTNAHNNIPVQYLSL